MKLDKILADHKKFLCGEEGGVKANLRDADLRGAYLRGADLSDADLSDANLSDADLRGAKINFADLSNANLSGADLSYANLSNANLSSTSLSDANLSYANLRDANLSYTNLRGSDLSDADLRATNLSYATLDEPICRMDFGGWSICIRSTYTTIGCKTYPNTEWLEATPDNPIIDNADPGASEWWQIHGDAIKGVIRCIVDKDLAKRKTI